MSSDSPDQEPSHRPTLGIAVRLLVSLGLLAWLLSLGDTRAALAQVSTPRTAWLVLCAALLYAACQFANAYKWDVLLRGMGYRIPYRALVRAWFVGQFANRLIPTAIGGDVVRVVAAAQHGLPYSAGILSAFLGRLTGLIAMLILGLVGSLAARGTGDAVGESILLGIAALCAVAVVAAVVGAFVELRFGISARLPVRLGRPLRRLADGLLALQRAPAVLAWVMLVSLAFQLMMVGLNALLGIPAGLDLTVMGWFWYNAGVTVGSMLPTFGGLGARELVAKQLLEPLGMGQAGVVCSVLWQAAVIVASLPGAWLWRGERRRIANLAPETSAPLAP